MVDMDCAVVPSVVLTSFFQKSGTFLRSIAQVNRCWKDTGRSPLCDQVAGEAHDALVRLAVRLVREEIAEGLEALAAKSHM